MEALLRIVKIYRKELLYFLKALKESIAMDEQLLCGGLMASFVSQIAKESIIEICLVLPVIILQYGNGRMLQCVGCLLF